MKIYSGTISLNGKIASIIFAKESDINFNGIDELIYPNFIQQDDNGEIYLTPVIDYGEQKSVQMNMDKIIGVSESTKNLSSVYMDVLAKVLNDGSKDVMLFDDYEEDELLLS